MNIHTVCGAEVELKIRSENKAVFTYYSNEKDFRAVGVQVPPTNSTPRSRGSTSATMPRPPVNRTPKKLPRRGNTVRNLPGKNPTNQGKPLKKVTGRCSKCKIIWKSKEDNEISKDQWCAQNYMDWL